MSLGMEIGIGPGDIVLGGNPALPTERDTAASTLFDPLCSGTVAHLSIVLKIFINHSK